MPDQTLITTVKDWAIVTKPLIDPIIAALVAPKIKSISDFVNKQSLKKKTSEAEIEKSFRNYLTSAYQKFCTMNVLAFPNQQILIHEIYQPLSLSSGGGYRSLRLNSFNKNDLKQFERILISDTGGMGKSTLLKWIGASTMEHKSSIPILIELKKINKTHKIINEICHQLGDIFGDFDKDIITKLISKGEFVFLLDGFDEIREEFKDIAIADIKSFVQKSSDNSFIMTSRPESSLAAFGDFQKFNINPLQLEESFELIRKYDSVNVSKIGEPLIKDINERLLQVQEFLVNPFLVSLLYKTYTYNKDIPSRKTTFYGEVYSALYKHHDLSKDGYKRDKRSGLDIEDFKTVLSQLAFDTAKAIQVEYYEHELTKLLNTAKSKCVGIEFKSNDFIEDIELIVPLFSREGNVLKWAHKSLQDFFAACYVSSSPRKEAIIQAIYSSEKSNYLNIIDFLYELEYKIVLNIILYDIAKSFVLFCNNSYKNITDVTPAQIRKRQELAFDTSYAFYYTEDIDNHAGVEAEELLEKYDVIKRNTEIFAYDYTKTSKFHNGSIHLVSSSFRHELLAVFAKKGLDIVKPVFVPKKSSANGIRAVTSLAFDTPYVIDDAKENPVNAPGRFDYISDLLISSNEVRNDMYTLDYEACVRLIILAESSIAAANEDNELEGL
jgi:hypothetical protein